MCSKRQTHGNEIHSALLFADRKFSVRSELRRHQAANGGGRVGADALHPLMMRDNTSRGPGLRQTGQPAARAADMHRSTSPPWQSGAPRDDSSCKVRSHPPWCAHPVVHPVVRCGVQPVVVAPHHVVLRISSELMKHNLPALLQRHPILTAATHSPQHPRVPPRRRNSAVVRSFRDFDPGRSGQLTGAELESSLLDLGVQTTSAARLHFQPFRWRRVARPHSSARAARRARPAHTAGASRRALPCIRCSVCRTSSGRQPTARAHCGMKFSCRRAGARSACVCIRATLSPHALTAASARRHVDPV